MLRLLCLVIALAGCGRPLTDVERAFADTLHGPALNADAVRVARVPLIDRFKMERPPRPQVACRERIHPPETGPVVRASVAGIVLFETLFASHPAWREDYLAGYPDTLPLREAMFLGHELTHVWQWQNRRLTGYHPLRAAAEHKPGDDPYLFAVALDRPFFDHGYEQQAALVEEYVCCRALDPEGARTARLRELLRPVFPALARDSRVPRDAVRLPPDAPKTAGICS